MDSGYRLYIQRANNEIKLADIIMALSKNKMLQLDLFKISQPETYFSATISHAYYCIFYSAKAYLLKKGIKTEPPDEHKKTLEEFEKLAISGEIDLELLKIYKSMVIKADYLLGIFIKEKSKRGQFTYKKLPQANLEPAKESLENAEKFLNNINLIIRKNNL